MAITIVQGPVTGIVGPGQTLGISLSATGAGNLLAVCIAAFNAIATETVSGVTLGGSGTGFAKASGATGSNSGAEIWSNPSCAAGQTALSISSTGGTSSNTTLIAAAWEVSGLAASSAVDKVAGATGTAGSFSSGSTATTTLANEIWFGIFAGQGGNSGTITAPASPWVNTGTLSHTVGGITTAYVMAGAQIVSSTGTAAYAGSQTNPAGAMHWACAAATFKAASGATGAPGPLLACFP